MANKKPQNGAGDVGNAQVENSSAKTAQAESGHPEKPEKAISAPKYTAADIAKAADTIYGGEFSQDIIVTALRVAGVKEATIDEAEEIIKEFAYKEVSE